MMHATETRPRLLRALIIDDEPLARRGLELRLAECADIAVVGQAGDGDVAVQMIRDLAPDVILLDVEMPELSGFQVLEAIPADLMPCVIFVTAFDHYALDAFKACAVDYLLKPVEAARLREALAKVRLHLERGELAWQRTKLLALVSSLCGKPELTLDEALADSLGTSFSVTTNISLRDGKRMVRVSPSEIRWIDAAGDYSCIHLNAETLVVRAPLTELEQRLDSAKFARIHRSTIVNIALVRSAMSVGNGECILLLEGGQELKVSRTYRQRVMEVIKA